ncbi:STAS domain-containing protein [Streptomyces erythrochromogenes]|uniref:STAS domain-containing protein n=1 Tax=Streptomyces erythrochromogenes TaxID=285574 RepID=UPI0036A2CD49
MPGPELKTDTVTAGDAVVCVLSGDLHLGTAGVADHALREALERHPALLGVDLSAVELFTAEGLNLLLALRDRAASQGVSLVLIAPSRGARHVLDTTGATLTFALYATVEEAIAQHEQ